MTLNHTHAVIEVYNIKTLLFLAFFGTLVSEQINGGLKYCQYSNGVILTVNSWDICPITNGQGNKMSDPKEWAIAFILVFGLACGLGGFVGNVMLLLELAPY